MCLVSPSQQKMKLNLVLLTTAVFGMAMAKPNIKPRLIGGQEAAPHAYPYMAYIMYLNGHGDRTFCGGVLISKNFIVTAASCLADMKLLATIKLGAVNPFIDEDTQVVVEYAEAKYHSKYNPTTHENDIGLIKLTEDVEENDNIKTLPLPTASQNFDGKTGVLTGWGLMDGNDGSSIARTLRYISAPILTNTECEKYLNGKIKSGHICLSGRGYATGCNGDTGGPLAVDGTLAGIFSFTAATCPVGLPSVATRITSYLDWLKTNMK